MKLTLKEVQNLEYVDLQNIPSDDFSEINFNDAMNYCLSLPEGSTKRNFVEVKLQVISFLKDDDTDKSPDGNLYYDEATDSLKEYISLDRLRFKIEELGKREMGDGFVLGKKAWEKIIKHELVAIGEKEGNSYRAYDDIDECYKAQHPRSLQQGFNLLCIKDFYVKKIEIIVRVKEIVDTFLEKEKRVKAKARQDAAKVKRDEEKALNHLGGLV